MVKNLKQCQNQTPNILPSAPTMQNYFANGFFPLNILQMFVLPKYSKTKVKKLFKKKYKPKS